MSKTIFQKRHYEALAKLIRELKVQTFPEIVTDVVLLRDLLAKLSDMLAEDNPNFNTDKFVHACGWHCLKAYFKNATIL